MSVLKLNIGCGKDWAKYPDFEGVDDVNFGQKYLLDLETDGLKGIADESVDAIMAFNVLEHITQSRVIFVMNECNRVLKNGAKLHIKVPPVQSMDEAFSDPTHKSYWTVKGFHKYWCGKSPRNADYGISKWAMDSLDDSDPGQIDITLRK